MIKTFGDVYHFFCKNDYIFKVMFIYLVDIYVLGENIVKSLAFTLVHIFYINRKLVFL
jgi:hypothetical protein